MSINISRLQNATRDLITFGLYVILSMFVLGLFTDIENNIFPVATTYEVSLAVCFWNL